MKYLDIAKKTLSFVQGDQVEVLVTAHDSSLTRFANSYIHQNVKETNCHVTVRVIRNNKQGFAETNSFEIDALKAVAQKAGEISDFSPKDPVQRILPGKSDYKQLDLPDLATISITPEQRAEAVKGMIDYANPLGLTIAGAYSNDHSYTAIANSNGIEAESEGAGANLKVTAMSTDSSGAAEVETPRVSEINPMMIIKEACDRAITSKNPIAIDPGEYEVVLLHYAAAELVGMMNWSGYSARSAEEGSCWTQFHMGKQIFSDKFTVIDDPFDPRGGQRAFDYEGFPAQKMTLINAGVPVTLVFDSYYATKTGKNNTGHATPASGGWGPFPMNIVVQGGNVSIDEMISKVKRGVLISRFWYSNLIRPLEIEFTGMTRDGLFLIEDGKIKAGLKNMRVTDSIIRILSGLIECENVTRSHDGIICPAMHCKGIKFSSGTLF